MLIRKMFSNTNYTYADIAKNECYTLMGVYFSESLYQNVYLTKERP